MKFSKYIFDIIFLLILFIILNIIINLFIDISYHFLSVDKNYENRYLKLILRPSFSLFLIIFLYIIYKKTNFRNYIFKSIFIVALSTPIFIEFISVIDYLVYKFSSKKFCYINYLDNQVLGWSFGLNIFVIFLSYIFFRKAKHFFNKKDIYLILIMIICFNLLVNIYRFYMLSKT